MTDKGHSPVGASSRYRWKKCAGSVVLCKTVPPPLPSKYAEEGTLAHEEAAYYLNNGDWSPTISDEMRENLKSYVEAVSLEKAALPKHKGNLFLVEKGFSLEMLHPEAWGTADCVIWDAHNKTLTVYDLKYGAGILVEAENNDQLAYYAVGALLTLNLPAKKVIVKIAQPRCPHPDGVVRAFEYDPITLLDEASLIKEEIEATEKPNAKLVAGDHCKFCPAAGVCPEINKKALAFAKNVFLTESYDPQLLADTLDKIPMIEAFVEQTREFAYSEAMRGRVPPNYKLVAKRATRKWIDEKETEKFLSAVVHGTLMRDCYTEPKLKSPAQIEKVIPKSQKEALAQFTTAESSGYKLVHSAEPGEPVLLDAKSLFSEGDSK